MKSRAFRLVLVSASAGVLVTLLAQYTIAAATQATTMQVNGGPPVSKVVVVPGTSGSVSGNADLDPDRDWGPLQMTGIPGNTGPITATMYVPWDSGALLTIRFSAETECGPENTNHYRVMCQIRMLVDGTCPDAGCRSEGVFDSGTEPLEPIGTNFFPEAAHSFEEYAKVGPGLQTITVQVKLNSFNPPAGGSDEFKFSNSLLTVERARIF